MESLPGKKILRLGLKNCLLVIFCGLSVSLSPGIEDDRWFRESFDSLRIQSNALKQEKSAMREILTNSLDYVRLLSVEKLPTLIYEFGFANGRTMSNLSQRDQAGDIVDNSLYVGVGLPLNLLNPSRGRVDFMAILNISRYSNDGNGWAIGPIANLSYTSPEILKLLAFYAGFGLGIGRDTMQLQGYTNEYKWTIDLFAGIQYTIIQNFFVRIGPLLRHKSHSFIGPWETQGSNIGYNGLMVEATMRVISL